MAGFLYACGQILGWVHYPLFFSCVIFLGWRTGQAVHPSPKLVLVNGYVAVGATIMMLGTWLTFGGCVITWIEDWLKHFAEPNQTGWQTSSMRERFAWVEHYWWVQYLIGPLTLASASALCAHGVIRYKRQKTQLRRTTQSRS